MKTWTTTTGILHAAHALLQGDQTIFEFSNQDVLRKAASRIMCHSRYHKAFRNRRYKTTQIVGVSKGPAIHYLLKVERIK